MNDLERMNEILYELSTDDLIIERIELIDMISPPARTKATMEPHLKTTDQDSENLDRLFLDEAPLSLLF